jgi:hypothetical protein
MLMSLIWGVRDRSLKYPPKKHRHRVLVIYRKNTFIITGLSLRSVHSYQGME